jgi:predicted ATPase
MREQEWSTRLMLNGEAIRLGTVADIVDKVHGRRAIQISLVDDDIDYVWSCEGERAEMSMRVERVEAEGVTATDSEMLRYLMPVSRPESPSGKLATRMRGLTYITAERVGPREVYSLTDRQSAPVVGPAGEHAVSVLQWGRDELVLESLTIPGSPPTRLRQVEERMRTFFPGCAIDVQPVPQANAVTLGIRTSDDTDFHRPIHVGFGLTQVLPIVVAALSAGVGDLILVENPEVHLHPSGQALMGQFLSEVANAGVQVIVETHSDHVLNGIRRAVKTRQLAADRVAIHFFQPRIGTGAQVVSPSIDRDGNIDSWPDGFFDQFDKDSNYFAGWGK